MGAPASLIPASGFSCQECGHKFKTLAAAERAAFGDAGCPKCGGADIDFAEVDPTPYLVAQKAVSK